MRHLRNKCHIHTSGTDIPDPLRSFEELKTEFGVEDVILRNIVNQDYKEPTGIQRQAIPVMMQVKKVITVI